MGRRSFSVASSTALLLAVAIASTGTVQAAPASDKASAKADHARIVKYWTPKRLANATPRDFVKTKRGFVPAGKGGTRGKPPKDPGDGGSGETSAVTGAYWNGGGAAQSATGKVFFTMDRDYVCSGAVIVDGSAAESLVLTAGHCVYDETHDRFATNWMFIPDYDDAANRGCSYDSSGCYSAHAGDLYVHPQYASAGGFNLQAIRHDWGFARVSDGGPDLDTEVAEFPIEFDAPNVFRHAFGYPAAAPYDGRELVYCAGDVISDRSTGRSTWGLPCDMTPGASGGPWMRGFAAGSGTIDSVNSYKYSGGQYRNYMFGPKFNAETSKVYQAALGKGGVAEVND